MKTSFLNRRARGFSLVELMIAMTIGLALISALLYVFMSNRQGYRTTEGLSRVQENARISFELMTRDLREAGSVPCGMNVPVANALNDSAGADWKNWANAIHGYESNDNGFPYATFGTAAGQRVAGTDAFQTIGGTGNGAVVMNHDSGADAITLQANADGLAAGDVAMICDYNQASIFQISAVAGTVISHASGGSAPGNCTDKLGFMTPYCDASMPARTYSGNAIVVRLAASGWYVGCNGRAACTEDAGRSLYRVVVRAGTPTIEEIVDGVRDLQIQYLAEGATDYVDAPSIADWSFVTAARLQSDLSTLDTGLSTTAGAANTTRITREVVNVVNLRNRVQ